MLAVLFAMFTFSLAMSITPGPVNMIILSSGVHYGVKKTLPYISGATIGFTLLLLFIGIAFFQVIKSHPAFLNYLAIIGSLYIIYIGYKIACSKPTIEIQKATIPKFYQGFLLQWINPKAWIACVSGVTLFSNSDNYEKFLIFSSIYFIVCYASLVAWAVLGNQISVFLKNNIRLKIFNIIMGILLIMTTVYLFFSHVT